jgi:endonuclease/exonuclease/phosphatase (EEP) superfamily protein YafD
MRTWVILCLIAVAYSYFALLGGWAALHALFPDRWWWLFLLTSLAVYLFLPLPFMLLITLLARRPELWLCCAAAALLWLHMYGALWLPRPRAIAEAGSTPPTFSIMSYNILVHNNEPERMLAAIQAADADVVALQEINAATAQVIRRNLAHVYPYQVIATAEDTSGMGVISRYPLHATGNTLSGSWIGPPQILTLEVAGHMVTLLNVHARSTSLGYGGTLRIHPQHIEASIREREQQIQMLAAFAAARQEPLIMVGDFNTGDQSRAYASLAAVLKDAWREAGHGFGHTFPGAATPGSSRPIIAGMRIPRWLIRIDYIFYSEHWRAASASPGPWDGTSDHRPVMARLQFLPDAQPGRQ